MRNIFVLGIIIAVNAPGLGQEDPDLKKEARFHSIYKKFNESPTAPERWQEALGRSKDQAYIIQKGDTLWDISETFFGDPYFWPKVWSVNPKIFNPHEILPKGVVIFSPGGTGEPPQMSLADASDPKLAEPNKDTEASAESPKDSSAPDGETPAVAQEEPKSNETVDLSPTKKIVSKMAEFDLSQVKLPPSTRPFRRVSPIPNSLPGIIFYQSPISEAKLELTRIRSSETVAPFAVAYFASDSSLTSVGEVIQPAKNSPGAVEGDIVFVKGDGVKPGNRLIAVKQMGSITNEADGGRGRANRIEGQLEIIGAVNSSSGIYRAKVIKSFAIITPESMLLAEEIPVVVPGGGGAMSPIPGEIVGGQHSLTRNLFHPYSIVYLNVGSNQGLQIGAHLPVYRNPKYRIPDSLIRENPAEIGELQVVRVGEQVATAVVLKAIEEIRVGDMTSPNIQ